MACSGGWSRRAVASRRRRLALDCGSLLPLSGEQPAATPPRPPRPLRFLQTIPADPEPNSDGAAAIPRRANGPRIMPGLPPAGWLRKAAAGLPQSKVLRTAVQGARQTPPYALARVPAGTPGTPAICPPISSLTGGSWRRVAAGEARRGLGRRAQLGLGAPRVDAPRVGAPRVDAPRGGDQSGTGILPVCQWLVAEFATAEKRGFCGGWWEIHLRSSRG